MGLRSITALILCWLITAPALAAGVTAYAAGDVADCEHGVRRSGAAETARLIPTDAYVLVLGDTAYPLADRATLENCYAPTWGRFLAHTFAVPGNHDYVNGSARDYLAYFGERTAHRTWYRASLGDWWVIGLDSNLYSAAELAEQEQWLDQQLKQIAGDGRCILAMWHHPLFSTGLRRHDGERMRPIWEALDKAGADLVLNGHEHFYESFEPRDSTGKIRPNGLREIIAGTGGAHLYDLSVKRGYKTFARVHGIVELHLQPDHYEYAFKTVKGKVRDSGGARCRRAPEP